MNADFYSKYRQSDLLNIPKYVDLREALRNAIINGFWKAGEKLPPEIEIAKTTPFSLGTVQKALQALVAEGMVERRQGHGTFVSNARLQMVDPWHFRFSLSDFNECLQVFPRVVSRNLVTLQTSWAKCLDPEGELIQIDRVISIADQFLIFSKFFISAQKFSIFMHKSEKELSAVNFKTILKQEYKISFTNLTHALRMVPLSDHVCQLIKVPHGTIGMALEILAISGYKNPIYYQEVYIPPNDYKISISDSSAIPECWR